MYEVGELARDNTVMMIEIASKMDLSLLFKINNLKFNVVLCFGLACFFCYKTDYWEAWGHFSDCPTVLNKC